MGLYAPKECFITGLPTRINSSSVDEVDYFITIGKKEHYFRFSANIDWDNQALKNSIYIFRAMRMNNEWPIDENTYIKQDLLDAILRISKYPRSFEEKEIYLLKYLFNNGGKEYYSIKIRSTAYHRAFAIDIGEFIRIVKGLKSKKLINVKETKTTSSDAGIIYTIDLLLAGKQMVQKLLDEEIPKNPLIRVQGNNTSVFLLSMDSDRDKGFSNKIQTILLNYGFQVNGNDLREGREYSNELTIKSILESPDINYAVYLKSNLSDSSPAMNSLVGFAIKRDEHQEGKFLFIAKITGEISGTRTIIGEYPTYDIRIISERERLARDIALAWMKNKEMLDIAEKNVQSVSRNDAAKNDNKIFNHNLPQLKITKEESEWLEIIYANFLNGDFLEYRHLKATYSDKFSQEFNALKINPLLLRSGDRITLLGIAQVDPESQIIRDCDLIIYEIQKIIREKSRVEKITSEELILRIPHLTHRNIYLIFSLLPDYGIFYGNIGRSNGEKDSPSSIGIDTNEIYDTYLSYKGIEDLLNAIVNKNNSEKTESNEDEIAKESFQIPASNEPLTKRGLNKSKWEFYNFYHNDEAAIGAKDLANEISDILKKLPNEEGMMFGVFGRWGRGKTFLMKEIWKKLEETDEFILIDFHAWKYQDTPASWAYLYEKFADCYYDDNSKKNIINKFSKRVDLNIEKHGYSPIVIFILLIILSIASYFVIRSVTFNFFSTVAQISVAIGTVSIISIIKLTYDFFKKNQAKAITLFEKYSKKTSFQNYLGIQAEIQKELKALLKVWLPEKNKIIQKRILLRVDDLDRCSEEKIIQIIDSLRIMLEDEEIFKRLVVLNAIDESVLIRAIKNKYLKLVKADFNSKAENTFKEKEKILKKLAGEYLDKLFIGGVKLGELTLDERNQIFNKISSKYRGNFVHEIFEEVKAAPESIVEKLNDVAPEIKSQDSSIQPRELKTEDIDIKNFVNATIYHELSFDEEIAILKNSLEDFEEATPRQIRILFFRYILTRNLLNLRYGTTDNIWNSETYFSDIPKLIINFSRENNAKIIQNEKERILKTNEENVIPHKLKNPRSKKEYLELLSVLEMVIAY